VGYGGSSHEAIIEATQVAPGAVDYFVELHIEQGPLLEKVLSSLSSLSTQAT
jgi:hypothetical protein